MVEMAYQKTKDLERLSFLYLSTGNTANLKRMQLIATKRKDINSRFHTALMLGDVPERVKILEEAGQRTPDSSSFLGRGFFLIADP